MKKKVLLLALLIGVITMLSGCRLPTDFQDVAELIDSLNQFDNTEQTKTLNQDIETILDIVSDSSKVVYYDDTAVPDYGFVTGAEFKKIQRMDDGDLLYIYEFTEADTVGKYWKYLVDDGWSIVSRDNTETRKTFESGYFKGDQRVLIFTQLDIDEVWVLPYVSE